jgi:carboxylate-amine ligase
VLACVHEPPTGPLPAREALVESSFRAGRDGLEATVWHDGALRPVRELAADAIERARPYARDVGAEDALEEAQRILSEGNGADRMRAAHAAGGMRGMLERLVAETAQPLAVEVN